MKKFLSMLICLSLILSLTGMPFALAAEPTTDEIPDSTIIYETNGMISVGCEYSLWNNYWIQFTYKGVNRLMQIYSLYIDSKSAAKPTNVINTSLSDWVGPFAFCVDDSEDTTVTWTGGAHGWENNTVASAYTESVSLKVDGVVVEKPTDANLTLKGKVAEITVVNLIKAGNDRDGDYSIRETVVYTISNNTIDVQTTLDALEDLRIHTYYGLQSINGPYTLTSFRNGNPNPATTGYYIFSSGPKTQYPDVDQAIHKTDNGDVLTVTLDRTYGMGTLEYNRKPSNAVAVTSEYNKTYFQQVMANNADDALALKAGESTGWKGQYKFHKEAPTAGAIEECEEIFFDDFSTDKNLASIYADTSVVDTTYTNETSVAIKNGLLDVSKPGMYGYSYIEFPETLIDTSSTDAESFVVELWSDVTGAGATSPTNCMYINRKNLASTYKDPRTVNGNYYAVYHKSTNTAYFIYPDGSVETKMDIPAKENGFSLGLRSVTKAADHDYIAVYTYANKFRGTVKYVNPTSAVLYTNMPIQAENNQFNVGDITATVEKAANTYNTYALTFSEALPKGINTLTGTLLKITCGEEEDISLDFDTRITECKELYFDDFSTDEGLDKLYADSTVVTANDAYETVLSTSDGMLKVTKPGYNYGFTYFEIPADSLNSNSTDANQFVIETKSAIQVETNDIYINRTKLYPTYANASKEDRCVNGNYYIVYNKVNNTGTFIFPDGSSEVKTGIPSGNNGFSVGFMGANSFQKVTSHDYIAVYTYADSFEGRLEDVTATSATLYTNLPITEESTLKVGDINATVTKKDNSYNTYLLTFAEELPAGKLTLDGKVMKLLDKAEEDVSIDFRRVEISPEITPENVLYSTDFDMERSGLTGQWTYYGADPGTDYIDIIKTDDGNSALSMTMGRKGTAESNPYEWKAISTPSVSRASDDTSSIVLEYRLRLPLMTLSAYFGGYNTSKTSASVHIGGAGYGGKVRWNSGVTDTIASIAPANEWHTITLEYSGTEAKRTLYIDGVKIGTSNDTFPSGFENNWFNNNLFCHSFILYGNNSNGKPTEAQLDYVKIYKKSDEFKMSIRNPKQTSTRSITVDFTSSPVRGRLTPESFSINGDVNIVSVTPVGNNGTAYELQLDKALDNSTEYQLTLNEATDTFGRTIEDEVYLFITREGFRDATIYAYHPFDDAAEISTWGNKSNVSVEKSDAGEGVLRFRNSKDGAATTGMISLPTIKNPNATTSDIRADIPEIALEMKVKTHYNTRDAYFSPRAMYTYESQSFGIGGYLGTNQLRPASSVGTKLETVTQDEWHTVTVVYNNERVGDGADTNGNPYSDRKIYYDGKLVHNSDAGNRANGWYQFGYLSQTLTFASGNATSTDDRIDIDYIKYYTPAALLDAEIEKSATPEELIINFNQTVLDISEENFVINGKNPASVELIDEMNQRYKLTFAELLNGETEYELTVTGITDTLENTLSGSFPFVTGKASAPQVTSASEAFVGAEDSEDAYTAYAFATYKTTDRNYVLKECGAVISSTVAVPQLNLEGCRRFRTLVPATKSGHFGIGIRDIKHSVLGTAYYMRPYVIYENNGEEFVYYGDVLMAEF